MSTDHWNEVYRTRAMDRVSWYRPHLDVSMAMLDATGLTQDSRVIDVGAGASTLVDDLLARGVKHVSCLDLSHEALQIAQQRLGERAREVVWLTGDVTRLPLPSQAFSHWHDRAVLHFLTAPNDVRAYARQAANALAPGGFALIGGFAPDGPERCSGLTVARRSAADIAASLGDAFTPVQSRHERHTTPAGNEQSFVYALLRRR